MSTRVLTTLRHGTRCAGEVAAQAFNEFCGVGIAYNASVGGVRMLDGTVTDQVEARALSLNPDYIDIYSASWGPEDDGNHHVCLANLVISFPISSILSVAFTILVYCCCSCCTACSLSLDHVIYHSDNSFFPSFLLWLLLLPAGKTVDGPGRLTKRAFVDGVRKGRHGLGSIFVWASGNGGRKQDNCNCDGYTNSIYTLSISSATQSGTKPWYLEECSSTLATTYSSGSPGMDQNIVTVDMDTTYGRTLRTGEPVTTYLCTLSHTGTSASAPIAAAVTALALEANPKLSWRDMQHLVIATSRPEPLRWESGWQVNGVGRQYSHKFGYGLMDAEGMVRLAEVWRTVSPQRICETSPMNKRMEIPVYGALQVRMSANGCQDSDKEIRYLEHVQARLTLKFKPRGNLKITLISPSGTLSTLLSPRIRDEFDDTFNEWPFLSVHFWGESPVGVWELRVENSNLKSSVPGSLISWTLVFHGTYDEPETVRRNNSILSLPRRSFNDDKLLAQDASQLQGIRGVVVDSGRHPLPDVSIRITGVQQDYKSRMDGSYWRILQPGNYTVTFNKPGYEDWSTDFQILPYGVTKWINVTMVDDTKVQSLVSNSTVGRLVTTPVSILVAGSLFLTMVVAGFCLINILSICSYGKYRGMRKVGDSVDEYSFARYHAKEKGMDVNDTDSEEELFSLTDVSQSKNSAAT